MGVWGDYLKLRRGRAYQRRDQKFRERLWRELAAAGWLTLRPIRGGWRLLRSLTVLGLRGASWSMRGAGPTKSTEIRPKPVGRSVSTRIRRPT